MKMNRIYSNDEFPVKRYSIALILMLATLVVGVPSARSQTSLTEEEKKKQIAEIEKQIAELQSKLNDVKKSTAVPAGTLPESVSSKFSWRCIGPSNMGGRITSIAVNPNDSTEYWVATASGGLLHTINNGTTFDFQFDTQATVSIGDVAVSASQPKTVWVGTGEANPRNSVSWGDGVYKSTDSGKTWKNMGLNKTFQIGKILIHPTNPDIVYVGALGRLYGPNPDRGVFKTTDGGKTWEKVHFVNDRTGVIDMQMDPKDPNTIIAAFWERKRDEFDGFFGTPPVPDAYGPIVTHGPSGGLWKTTDAGKTWKHLSDPKKPNGLPTVPTGRIGLDYSQKTQGKIYAIIDTELVGTGEILPTYFGAVINNAPGSGAKLTDVTKGGPADKAGVKSEDVVIEVDQQPVENSDVFIDYFMSKKPNTVIKLKIQREKETKIIDVTLGQRELKPPPPLAGFRFGDNKLVVESVNDNSPADRGGLKHGDTITAIDGKEIKTIAEYQAAVKAKKPGDKTKYTVKRGKDIRELEITLASASQGARGQSLDRPYGLGLGGQSANVQRRQGIEGHQTGGVYVSKDNGETWTRVNSFNPRPMYFSVVRVDPSDDETIYLLGDTPTPLFRSTNGGKFITNVQSANHVHADSHAFWIDPKNPRHMLIGCDGGFYVSYDTGTKWEHLNNFPLGQFYHICVDNRKPYNVYGGLQDNGSWSGPSDTLRRTGQVNDDWKFVSGGDGCGCRVDPNDADCGYTEFQGGNIMRRNYRTGETGFIKPQRKDGQPPLRMNWNTPYFLSHHNSSIFYCASQHVYRSVKRGDDLKMISPELTRSKAGSIVALAESQQNHEVLWAGTDDGYLWITRDGGNKWQNVTDNLIKAGLPAHRYIASIETSRTVDGRVYVACDAHRSNDDKPYLFVTEDFGTTWKAIHSNLPAFGSTRVCREDIVNPNVLYVGTEFGAYVTINRGGSWSKLGGNLPTVACHEFAQPTTASELVVGTHGRSIWVLDVHSIRQLTPEVLNSQVNLFTPATAVRWKTLPSSESAYSQSDHKFFGTNPTRGAKFDILMNTKPKKVTLSVLDAAGNVVWKAPEGAIRSMSEVGMHRIVWNLGGSSPTGGPRAIGGGVPPGAYKLVLNVDDKEQAKTFQVEIDPNATKDLVSTEDDFELTEKDRKSRKVENKLDN